MEAALVLLEKSQAGDKAAREVLIESNLGLVHHIVKRFFNRGYDVEDLFQIGTIGLIKAIDKFDLSYDVKFSTYAVPMILGEIKRFLRDDGMIKVSRTVKENGLKAKMAEQRLLGRLGREPTLLEVAEEAGLNREEIVLALEAGAEVESIYKSVPQADGSEIFLVDKVAGNSGNSTGELLNHLLLKQLLEGLTERERSLITMRYFEDRTQSEVAEKLGISQVQVSRLEKKILLHMRSEVTA